MLHRSCLLFLLWGGFTDGWFWWGYYYRPWADHDKTGLSSKYKMRNLTHELLSQAYMKVRTVMDIRDYHSDTSAYEVGYIMGKVREKYRLMMEHYNQWRDKASGKSIFVGPGIQDIYPLHFLMTMEFIIMYEFDINKYCETLLYHYQNDDLVLYDGKMHRPSKKKKKKSKADASGAASLRRMREVALKRKYRAQHLARRLGLPENYTTKSKRFVNNWPVEGTWDNLGPYDMGI